MPGVVARLTVRPYQATDTRMRNLLWLQATDRGLPDPLTGRVRVYTAVELARLWGVSPSAVSHGIRRARATLRGLADVLEPP